MFVYYVQDSKLTGALLPGACKICLRQLQSLGKLPQWATGFLYAGQLLGMLDLEGWTVTASRCLSGRKLCMRHRAQS